MSVKLDLNEFGYFIITGSEGQVMIYPKTFNQLVDYIEEFKVNKISNNIYNATKHATDWRVLALSDKLITYNEIIASHKLESQDPKYIN